MWPCLDRVFGLPFKATWQSHHSAIFSLVRKASLCVQSEWPVPSRGLLLPTRCRCALLPCGMTCVQFVGSPGGPLLCVPVTSLALWLKPSCLFFTFYWGSTHLKVCLCSQTGAVPQSPEFKGNASSSRVGFSVEDAHCLRGHMGLWNQKNCPRKLVLEQYQVLITATQAWYRWKKEVTQIFFFFCHKRYCSDMKFSRYIPACRAQQREAEHWNHPIRKTDLTFLALIVV